MDYVEDKDYKENKHYKMKLFWLCDQNKRWNNTIISHKQCERRKDTGRPITWFL